MKNELLDDLSALHLSEEDNLRPVSEGAKIRFIAFLLDLLSLSMLGICLATFGSIIITLFPSDISFLIAKSLFFIILVLYYPVLESSALQGSLGKLAVLLKVVDSKGERITFWSALSRLGATLIACLIFFIGVLMILFTDKRGMHDMMTDTYVVKKEKK